VISRGLPATPTLNVSQSVKGISVDTKIGTMASLVLVVYWLSFVSVFVFIPTNVVTVPRDVISLSLVEEI
jgi:hypothetical protein